MKELRLTDIERERDQYLKTPLAKKYYESLKETKYHKLHFSFIQGKPKLMWELRNALPVFFHLVSHVNRNDGSKGPVWAELDRLFKKGYLATVRHVKYMAKELGCSEGTVTKALSDLEDKGFMRIVRNYTWGSQRKGWNHANLYVLGYIEDVGEMWLYHTASQEMNNR